MSIERNKQIVRDFFARFSASDIDGALALMSEDATWWIAGTPGQSQRCGEHSKERIARLFKYMVAQTESGLAMTVKNLIAEGEQVAAEMESLGHLRNGRVYRQQYHLLITLRDERIVSVREYLDTFHVHAVWFEPTAAAATP
jgi:ketosteroid isomerase-like protein